MRITPEIEAVSIVLVGNFNPVIFTPAWFALHELLPERIAATAQLVLAHKAIVQFNAEWLRLEVTRDQFRAETVQAPHVRVRDLVIRVFREHLHHTPVRAFGINRKVHFLVKSYAARDALGKKLAPVEPWGDLGRELGLDGEYGGLSSLRMTQSKPEGRPEGGRINITVEPSGSNWRHGRLGVYVACNDHYAIGGTEPSAAGDSMELLKNRFEASLSRSEKIIRSHHVASVEQGGLVNGAAGCFHGNATWRNAGEVYRNADTSITDGIAARIVPALWKREVQQRNAAHDAGSESAGQPIRDSIYRLRAECQQTNRQFPGYPNTRCVGPKSPCPAGVGRTCARNPPDRFPGPTGGPHEPALAMQERKLKFPGPSSRMRTMPGCAREAFSAG